MTSKKQASDELKARFFEGMSFTATTVNVVTTDGAAGREGVTVSAMSSVSADTPKPTLLVCINQTSSAAEVILENGVLCVNVLRDNQSYISDSFAGRHKDKLKDKFDCTNWETGVTGAPRVADGFVAFDCHVVSSQKIGSHHVCFAEVQDVIFGELGSALIYANRAYSVSSLIEQTEPTALPAQASKDNSTISNDSKSGHPKSGQFELENWPFYWLGHAYRQHQTTMETALSTIDLDVPTWRVLMLLKGAEARSVSYLAKEAIAKLSTMTRIIHRMQKVGLVETRRSPKDARVTEVLLTKSGQKARVKAWNKADEVYTKSFKNFDSENVNQLTRLLEQLSANLKHNAKNT